MYWCLPELLPNSPTVKLLTKHYCMDSIIGSLPHVPWWQLGRPSLRQLWTPIHHAGMTVSGALCARINANHAKIGSFLHVFGLMMASISKEYYQFLLSQAVCSSIGASMVFYPAFSTIVTWFFKKRAMAVGIAASGSSLGGIIFPIMVQRLVGEVGFGWTMRICAFLILALLIVANLFVKSRIPPHPRPVKLMDFITPLTEPAFALLTMVWLSFSPRLTTLAKCHRRACSCTSWDFSYLSHLSSSKLLQKG